MNCKNNHCRTRLSRCDGRGLSRCAQCVRLRIVVYDPRKIPEQKE